MALEHAKQCRHVGRNIVDDFDLGPAIAAKEDAAHADKGFGVSRTAPSRFDLTKLVPMLEDVHDRLAGVTIERLPWADFIPRYDTPDTLFFLDPPYWGNEADYGAGVFGRDDFDRIRATLGRLQGRFVMTINDRPEIRAMFAEFTIKPVELLYRVSGKATPARELIISNV